MKINSDPINKVCPETEVFESVLSLNHKKILELGCGDATLTRLIAEMGQDRSITATEVDIIQHEKNLLINDLPNVSFELAGSQNIPASNNSFDIVLMFKSFHHVPVHLMEQALQEIKRVLKPNGMVYISEPVFAGELNEIIRLFHNEEFVRKAAFDAIEKAVADKLFLLEDELFFYIPVSFENFAQFEKKVIAATYSEHRLSDELYEDVKHRFSQIFAGNDGHFLKPMRVDILTSEHL